MSDVFAEEQELCCVSVSVLGCVVSRCREGEQTPLVTNSSSAVHLFIFIFTTVTKIWTAIRYFSESPPSVISWRLKVCSFKKVYDITNTVKRQSVSFRERKGKMGGKITLGLGFIQWTCLHLKDNSLLTVTKKRGKENGIWSCSDPWWRCHNIVGSLNSKPKHLSYFKVKHKGE